MTEAKTEVTEEKKVESKKAEFEFKPGDIIRVSAKVKEAGKERIQQFEGTVLAIRGRGENKSFTVRRIATGGIGVERIWPIHSPSVTEIKIIKKGNVNRAKLYYLRHKKGK
ncbi:MAG: 50S ribosomal protein L19 [Patescibacteria group bacterium]|nr:50S ribosomal protein L19 [Patescibacteria group bacterium]